MECSVCVCVCGKDTETTKGAFKGLVPRRDKDKMDKRRKRVVNQR